MVQSGRIAPSVARTRGRSRFASEASLFERFFWGNMKTRELLIVMGTLGSTFVLLYGWPTLHRYEQTVDGRLVRISRVTHETRLLEEGRGWVKPNQASAPRSNFCESTCPKPLSSANNPWRAEASVMQPRSWTLSPEQQQARADAVAAAQAASAAEQNNRRSVLQSSAAELNLGGSSSCSCQNNGFLWRLVKSLFGD